MSDIPEDIRFESGISDPDRDWCISLKQPMASLIADGSLQCFTLGMPPPFTFIGRRIFIHAGGSDLPYKVFSDEQRKAVQMRFGQTLEAARRDLPKGMIVASAEIRAAYIVGRAGEGVVWSSPKEKDWTRALGDWEACSPFRGLFLGDWSYGQWAWFLKDMRPEPHRALKGFSGLFDLEHAFALREQKDRAA